MFHKLCNKNSERSHTKEYSILVNSVYNRIGTLYKCDLHHQEVWKHYVALSAVVSVGCFTNGLF